MDTTAVDAKEVKEDALEAVTPTEEVEVDVMMIDAMTTDATMTDATTTVEAIDASHREESAIMKEMKVDVLIETIEIQELIDMTEIETTEITETIDVTTVDLRDVIMIVETETTTETIDVKILTQGADNLAEEEMK